VNKKKQKYLAKKKYVCEKCGPVPAERTTTEERRETFSVRGAPISLLTKVRVCSCGRAIYDRNLDSRNIDAAYDLYRAQFGRL